MKTGTFSMAVVLTLAFSGSANADLVEVSVIYGPSQHPDGLHDTWQVIAIFDNPLDQIAAVAGLEGQPLYFYTGNGVLYNQALFDGLSLNDYPSVVVGGEAYDSYITLGNTNIGNVAVTPEFLGGTGQNQVILGSTWTESDGAWYFPQGPLEVGLLEDAVDGNDTSDVVIAQFTVDEGMGFWLEGNIVWLGADGSYITAFNTWPAPGVLVMFGLAGLVGTRRRRG